MRVEDMQFLAHFSKWLYASVDGGEHDAFEARAVLPLPLFNERGLIDRAWRCGAPPRDLRRGGCWFQAPPRGWGLRGVIHSAVVLLFP